MMLNNITNVKNEEDSPDPETVPLDAYDSMFLESNENNAPTESYGQLLPLQSTGKDSSVIDLVKDHYTFGRGKVADIRLQNYIHAKFVARSSALHFQLSREMLAGHWVTVIEDTSRIGTYVNREKIGKGNKRVLVGKDIISVVIKSNEIFHYVDFEEKKKYPKELLEKYIVTERILGSGAAALVQLVHGKTSSVPMAMKSITVSDRKGEINSRDVVERELNMLPTLDHPFIIRTHDTFHSASKETAYVVMELAQEGSLLEFILSEQKLPEHSVKIIFQQILLAVNYLHDRGITHRDLKPDNVLLVNKESLHVKLADFGLSKELESLNTLVGTTKYMAPEVRYRKEEESYSCVADVWSLGVMLYICLTGRDPSLDDGIDSYLEDPKALQYAVDQRLMGGSEHWENLSEEASQLIFRMVTVKPESRITVKHALNHKFFEDKGVRAAVDSLKKSNCEIGEVWSENKENRKRGTQITCDDGCTRETKRVKYC